MKIKNNFVSVVTIGNFNPAILTQGFLEKDCDFRFEGNPTRVEKTPVVSRIKYSRLDFVVDLERLQIVEYGVANPEDSDVANYVRVYLTKLPYTPVFVCGVNINVDISGLDEKSLVKLLTEGKNDLFQILETRDYQMETTSHHQASRKERYSKWDINYAIKQKEILGRITISTKEDAIWRVNYNYEVRGLERQPTRLKQITAHYPEIVERYRGVVDNIFKGA